MITPVNATIKPAIDLYVNFSLKKATESKNANTGTSEKIVWATEGSISDTVYNDKHTPDTGPKIVPATAYFTPLFLFVRTGVKTFFIFPVKRVKTNKEEAAAVKRINVA